MSAITRTWIAFAAIGTGLIHLALVLGSPLPLGIVLGVLGLAEFAWGVLTFAREAAPAPRLGLAVALVPVLAWAVLLGASSVFEIPAIAASLTFLPLAIASGFELFAAALLGIHLRQRAEGRAAPAIPSVRRYLIGFGVGAVVVAGLTTPALAATEAGSFAQPSGTTGIVTNHGH